MIEEKREHRQLSPLAERLAPLLAEAAAVTAANRNTLKNKFGELVGQGLAELHGKGRGAHYRPAVPDCGQPPAAV